MARLAWFPERTPMGGSGGDQGGSGRWRKQEEPERASRKGRSRETHGSQGRSEDSGPSPCGVIAQTEGRSRPAGLGVRAHGPGVGGRPHPRLGSRQASYWSSRREAPGPGGAQGQGQSIV